MRLLERMPALGHRDYRNFQIGSFISNVGNRMQWATILWHVFHLTNSSFSVGLIGVVQVIPLLIFSLYGGVIADQFDRRSIILITNVGLMFVSVLAVVATVSYGDGMHVLWLYLVVGLNSMVSSFNGPARQAIVPSLVPMSDIPNAISINGILWRLSDILGPVIGAFLLGWKGAWGISGLAWVYVLNGLSFGAVLFVTALLPPRPPDPALRSEGVREVLIAIKDGLHFVWNTRVVRSALFIDFWATLFAGAEALFPAIQKILHMPDYQYGWLLGAGGVGALLASSVLAWMPTVRHQGRLVLYMIAAYGVFTILFGISTNLICVLIFLAAVGAADMISTVMRQTIRQLATPDPMRGRMSAASSVLQMSGPKLGDFEAGAVAGLVGPQASIVIGGIGSLLTATWFWRSKALRDYEHKEETAS